MDRNLEGLKIAVLVGGGLLALFFAGQVFQLAARWTARAISGAVLIVTALLVGYAVYQVYTGWSAAADETTSETQDHTTGDAVDDDPSSLDGLEQEYVEGDLSETEFERELESVLEDRNESETITETEQ